MTCTWSVVIFTMTCRRDAIFCRLYRAAQLFARAWNTPYWFISTIYMSVQSVARRRKTETELGSWKQNFNSRTAERYFVPSGDCELWLICVFCTHEEHHKHQLKMARLDWNEDELWKKSAHPVIIDKSQVQDFWALVYTDLYSIYMEKHEASWD